MAPDRERRTGLGAATLLERWKHLPPVDHGRLHADIDTVIEPRL